MNEVREDGGVDRRRNGIEIKADKMLLNLFQLEELKGGGDA